MEEAQIKIKRDSESLVLGVEDSNLTSFYQLYSLPVSISSKIGRGWFLPLMIAPTLEHFKAYAFTNPDHSCSWSTTAGYG